MWMLRKLGHPFVGTFSIQRSFTRMLTLLLVASIVVLSGCSSTNTVVSRGGMNEFVTRSGSQLMLGGRQFRFAGANVYWLGLDENVDGVDYPTHFRVNDALTAAETMGATVVRSHTLGISVGCEQCVEPSLGVFNTTAFEHIDYAIQAANAHHLRLILPLTDNWAYYHGGRGTFTTWRGIHDADQFYQDDTVISDFEQYIYQVLNHVNSYTHRKYKDDPTILAWETGNELRAPLSWVQKISAYIKKIDTHHLVMDGDAMTNEATPDVKDDLSLDTVDMYTGHYYPLNIDKMKQDVEQVQSMHKVFVVGEYDWTNHRGGDPLANFLHEVEQNKAISGDLYWSLFGRDDKGKYVQHHDGYTLHYPGDNADMRTRVNMLSKHARNM